MSNPLGCSLKYSQSYFRFKIFAVNEPLIDVSPLVTSMSPEISSAEAEVTFTSPVRELPKMPVRELPKIEQGLLTGKHRQSNVLSREVQTSRLLLLLLARPSESQLSLRSQA